MSYDPQFQHPDGRMKTSAERADYRRSQDRARQLAQASAAHAKRQNAKPTSGHEGRISELRDQLARAFDRGERQQIKRRLAQHLQAHEQWEAERVQLAFQREFEKSDLCKLAGQSVEAIRRSGSVLYPSASAEELNGLLALFDVRHDFPTPGDFAREFFVALGAIEDKEAEAAQKLADDNRIEAERLQAESLRSQTAALEAQQRASQARSVLDDE